MLLDGANYFLVTVDEAWLKGKNRPQYFRILRDHIHYVIKAFHTSEYKIENQHNRFVIYSQSGFNASTGTALGKIPGISVVTPAYESPLDMNEASKLLISELKRRMPLAKTFKVISSRTNKLFSPHSMEINQIFGGEVLKNFPGIRVDVHNPQLKINVRVLDNGIFLSFESIKGIGGLPYGTSGHVLSLLSGGFDSPVASFMMARRGCKISLVFFHAYPFVGNEVKEKIKELAKSLSPYLMYAKLYIVPFGEIQKAISLVCKEQYRTMLFRHFMIQVATKIAQSVDALALITGDSLGQVSSQTLTNIAAIEERASLPILRPLIGLNKTEIIQMSREIGTHDVSVIPHDDACSLFAPKHPVIKMDRSYWNNILDEYPLGEEVDAAVANTECFSLRLNSDIVQITSDKVKY